MNDFLKCACPHCGQSIEYPAEGTGQAVPCPTCERSFVLMPANAQSNSNSNEELTESVKDESRARKAAKSKYPDRDTAYYGRPATEEQLEKIRELNDESVRVDGEPAYDPEALTYGEAKDIIQKDELARRKEAEEAEMNKHSNPPSKAQLEWLKKSGIKLDSSLKITEWELEHIIGLEKLPPSEDDLRFFKQHGVISFKGDGLGAFLFADLIRSFGGSAQNHNRAKISYGPPCQTALRDPAYHKPTLSQDDEGIFAFTWPKSKIRQWLRS